MADPQLSWGGLVLAIAAGAAVSYLSHRGILLRRLRAALKRVQESRERLSAAADGWRGLGGREGVPLQLTEVFRALTRAGEAQWAGSLDEALAALGELVEFDRSALILLDPDSGRMDWEHTWEASRVGPVPPWDQVANLGSLPWVARQILAGGVVHVPDVAALPVAAAAERRRWQGLDMKSLFAVPMVAHGRVIGLMAFARTRRRAGWCPEDRRVLETVAAMVTSTWYQGEVRREQRQANRRLLDIIEFLPDPTFVIDGDGRVVAWNKAMAGLTGRNADEMLGRGDRAYAIPFRGDRTPLLIDHFTDAPPADFADHYAFIEIMQDTIYGETFVPFLNDGQGAWLWCTASPLYDDEGQVVGAIESLRDVTYRRMADQAVRQSEDRYRELVETMNDGMGMVDPEGCISFVNDRLCEMTGFAREDLVGLPIARFVTEAGEDWDAGAWWGWQLARGEAIETEIPCRDGTFMPVRVSPSPLRDRDGAFTGGFAVVTDMTSIRDAERRYRHLNENLEKRIIENTRELVAANEALRRSEGRYRRIIESLRDGCIFYSLDTRGEFTYVSPSFRDVLGYPDLASLFAAWRDWRDEPRNGQARATSDKARLGFKQPPYDLYARDADGEDRILEVLEAPVFDEHHNLLSVEGIMRDVTRDRRNQRLVRETQAALLESEKLAALGGLVAGVSHEINTPVGIGVTASSHLCELHDECSRAYREGRLTEQAFADFLAHGRESAELVQTNLMRAADLLQNFKKVAVDQSAGEVRTFGLAEFLDDVLRSLSPRLRDSGYRVHCHCPPDLEMVCDPGALYQILSNLIINSLNHGFDGLLVGDITIAARIDHDRLVLVYSDNGVGMDQEQITRIYEPFFTTRRGRGGTGLGMHIVYNNVTQTLGGSIRCASRPGRGARFTIAVPQPVEVEHA